MDALPQAPKPSFKPKVVALYESLFQVRIPITGLINQDFEAEEHTFPFDDLFILQPRPAEFSAILSSLDGNDFSSIHTTTQMLFMEGVKVLESRDDLKIDNVLVVKCKIARMTVDVTNLSKCAPGKTIP